MTFQSRLKTIGGRLSRLAAEIAHLQSSAGTLVPRNRQPSNSVSDRLIAFLALAQPLERAELLQTVLRCAMHVVNGGGAGLTLLDGRKQRLVFRAAVGQGADGIIGQNVPLRGSRHGLAFATGEVQSATPIYSALEKKAKARFRNVLVAPLLAHGEPVGTISVVNKQDAEHFTTQDIAAIKGFADLAAIVVRQQGREHYLRSGIGSGKARHLPAAFTSDDRELLDLFEALTRVRQTRPDLLPRLRQLIEGLTPEAVSR